MVVDAANLISLQHALALRQQTIPRVYFLPTPLYLVNALDNFHIYGVANID